MTISRVGNGTAGALTTAGVAAHPASLATNDKLILFAAAQSATAIADPSGWTLAAEGDGGGVRAKLWEKDHDGGSTSNVTVNTTGGVRGVTFIEAYRSSLATPLLMAAQIGTDTDTSSTAFSATAPASETTAAGDGIVGFLLMVTGTGTYSGNPASRVINQTGATSGGQNGNHSGRTGGNLAAWASDWRLLTGGATNPLFYTATATTGTGATAAGAAGLFRLREQLAPPLQHPAYRLLPILAR